MTYIYVLMIGSAAGIASGLFGIGGGIISVPALTLILGYTQKEASGTSLVAMLLPVGILGVWEYYKSGIIGASNIKYGLLIAAGILIGTYFGSQLSIGLPEFWLRRGFSIFIALVAVRLWISTV